MKNLPKLRKALYAVGMAGAALGVGYGFLTETQALLWLGLYGAVLGVAYYNVDDSPQG